MEFKALIQKVATLDLWSRSHPLCHPLLSPSPWKWIGELRKWEQTKSKAFHETQERKMNVTHSSQSERPGGGGGGEVLLEKQAMRGETRELARGKGEKKSHLVQEVTWSAKGKGEDIKVVHYHKWGFQQRRMASFLLSKIRHRGRGRKWWVSHWLNLSFTHPAGSLWTTQAIALFRHYRTDVGNVWIWAV